MAGVWTYPLSNACTSCRISENRWLCLFLDLDEQRGESQSFSMRLLLRFKIKILWITQVHSGNAYRLPIASCAYHPKRPVGMHRANLLEGESAFRAIPVRNASAHFNKRHRP